MSFQDNYTQLPPGLDPSNLARLAQMANQRAQAAQQAQEQELPPEPPPQPGRQQDQKDQQRASETEGTSADTSTEPAADTSTGPADEPVTEPPAEPPQPPQQMARLDPATGRVMVPQLQHRNDPYVPVSARPRAEWGGDWWPIAAFATNSSMQFGPFMPSPMEAYGVIRGAGAQLAQWGAPGYGQNYGQASIMAQMMGPWLDALTGGRFTKGFNAARMGTLKMQREQMMLNQAQALQQHKQFLLGANEIFGMYEFGGSDKEESEHKMEDYLIQSGHQNLINMLHTKGMSGVMKYLEWEDQKYRDGLAAHTSIKKATGDTDADKDRAFEGEAGGDPDSPEARARKAETFGPDIGRTGPGTPSAPEAPKTPPLGESGDINAELKKAMPGATDKEVEAARAVASGEEMPDVSDAKQARINALASKIRGGIKQIAEQPAAPGDIAAEQAKIDRIKKIDFGKGSMLDSIIHYKQDPDKLPIKGREKLLELAHSIRHNYDPGKYKAVEQFSLPSSVENRTVSRASGMLQGYVSVLRALKPFEEGQKIPSNVVQAWVAGHWSGDPKYYELESAIAQMGQETSAVTTGGVPRQGLTKMLLNEVSRTASPAQIRSALLTHMRNGWAFIDGYQRQYDNLTGGGDFVPGLGGRDNWNLFSSILRMNPYTGEVPEDAPDELRDVGKPYTERSGRIKTNPYEDFRPPRSDHVPDIRRYIKEHQNDKDPAVRADVERFKRMIGGTLHLPRMIPEGKSPADAVD